MTRPIVYHIPVCPFSQRLEILLTLKDVREEVDFHVVDITRPRPPWLLEKTGGTSALPILEISGGRFINMRFWFLEYYEDFALPADERYVRVRKWIEACVAHPAAQQVTREQVVKLYYDYAQGAGNGALLPGRQYSSFAFEPHWRMRPWPPKNKYGHHATDEELGLQSA